MALNSLHHWYERHKEALSIAFFVAGFVFDALTLGRIDSWVTIAQQAAYLVIAAGLVAAETLEKSGSLAVRGRWARAWVYRDGAVHFILGSLLSAYTLFYFKAASFLSSFVFITLLSALLVANEFARFRGLGTGLRMAIFSLCLLSYLIYTVPILLGYIGPVPFLLAVLASACLCYLVYLVLKRRIPDDRVLGRQVRLPMLVVHLVFALLYFAQILPPVPLSAIYMGVYHKVERQGDTYRLHYTRPWWKFWQNGDQSFAYRPGDALYGYASVFSPSGFKDRIQVRWLWHSGKGGWQTADVIPMEIVGGREKGFRGYTVKRSVRPGKWRFQLETTDGREVGRLYFTVFPAEESEGREITTELD